MRLVPSLRADPLANLAARIDPVRLITFAFGYFCSVPLALTAVLALIDSFVPLGPLRAALWISCAVSLSIVVFIFCWLPGLMILYMLFHPRDGWYHLRSRRHASRWYHAWIALNRCFISLFLTVLTLAPFAAIGVLARLVILRHPR